MSDPAPMASPDADAPDADEVGERNVVLRALIRVRALLVLVPLVGGLLVAASIGASKLWADIPERGTAAPEVTCWDGTTATLGACPAPTGKAGLRWVFPSFRTADSDGRCARVERRARDGGRPVEFACTLRVDQREVTVLYTARTSLERSLAFLERTYGVAPVEEADGERLVYRAQEPDENGIYRIAVAYAEHPYSVTVEAPAIDVRDTALGELVDFRPVDRLLTRG